MAMVMDRLFLLIFTVAVLVGTAGIILQVGAGRGSEGKRHSNLLKIIFFVLMGYLGTQLQSTFVSKKPPKFELDEDILGKLSRQSL